MTGLRPVAQLDPDADGDRLDQFIAALRGERDEARREIATLRYDLDTRVDAAVAARLKQISEAHERQRNLALTEHDKIRRELETRCKAAEERLAAARRPTPRLDLEQQLATAQALQERTSQERAGLSTQVRQLSEEIAKLQRERKSHSLALDHAKRELVTSHDADVEARVASAVAAQLRQLTAEHERQLRVASTKHDQIRIELEARCKSAEERLAAAERLPPPRPDLEQQLATVQALQKRTSQERESLSAQVKEFTAEIEKLERERKSHSLALEQARRELATSREGTDARVAAAIAERLPALQRDFDRQLTAAGALMKQESQEQESLRAQVRQLTTDLETLRREKGPSPLRALQGYQSGIAPLYEDALETARQAERSKASEQLRALEIKLIESHQTLAAIKAENEYLHSQMQDRDRHLAAARQPAEVQERELRALREENRTLRLDLEIIHGQIVALSQEPERRGPSEKSSFSQSQGTSAATAARIRELEQELAQERSLRTQAERDVRSLTAAAKARFGR
jgi:chromosome segregation ATPase